MDAGNEFPERMTVVQGSGTCQVAHQELDTIMASELAGGLLKP